jgi:hypothetical protein
VVGTAFLDEVGLAALAEAAELGGDGAGVDAAVQLAADTGEPLAGDLAGGGGLAGRLAVEDDGETRGSGGALLLLLLLLLVIGCSGWDAPSSPRTSAGSS